MISESSRKTTSLPPALIDYDLQFDDSALVAALNYWRSRCRGDRHPRRSDIDPLDMRGFIGQVALIDILDDDHGARTYRVRLAARSLEAVYGPVTGKELGQFLPPEIEERWRMLFDAVLAANAPVRHSGQVAFADKSWLHCEVLLAPLSDESERTAMLFLTVTFGDRIDR